MVETNSILSVTTPYVEALNFKTVKQNYKKEENIVKNTVISEASEKSICLYISTKESEGFSRILSFNELLLKAIDAALSSLVGSAKERLYYYLEKTAGIRKKEIPSEIEKFAKAIEKIFGCGAYLIEMEIMKRLYRKLGTDLEYWPEKGKLGFGEYVNAVRLSNKIIENIESKT